MENIENMLKERKKTLDKVEVPEELGARLSRALNGKRALKRRNNSWKIKVATVCLAVLLVGYNLNTLAFYGKKLLGYDRVMNGTLKQLNELGKGQLIGKSHTFQNGVSVTLDGIMLDESQLLAFYTVHDPRGKVDSVNLQPLMQIDGLFGSYMMEGGQGEMNEENTEIKWIMGFEPPFFLERTLHFKFGLIDSNILEEGVISFKLDRTKAMERTLKKTIDQTFELEQTKIKFESILASPTRTVIYGSIQNILELARDQLSGERLRTNHLTVRLVANNNEVISHQGGSISTDIRGITFEQSFDALPVDLQALHITLESISVERDVNEKVDLNRDETKREIEILGQEVEINGVYESNDSTLITITTDESTVLTKVYLMIDGNKVELQNTVTNNREKLPNGPIRHTRTLHFPGKGEELTLHIERINFTEFHNITFEVPVN
ncbi:MAG: DUF4179 domain-containing protein [Firmicutes bacterium]|nr:DUF4179 domain-containing protein [Bacillota bacterium]